MPVWPRGEDAVELVVSESLRAVESAVVLDGEDIAIVGRPQTEAVAEAEDGLRGSGGGQEDGLKAIVVIVRGDDAGEGPCDSAR